MTLLWYCKKKWRKISDLRQVYYAIQEFFNSSIDQFLQTNFYIVVSSSFKKLERILHKAYEK